MFLFRFSRFLFPMLVMSIYLPNDSFFLERVEQLELSGKKLVKYSAIKNYWVNEYFFPPLLTLDFVSDSIRYTKLSFFLIYDISPMTIVIEPVIKFGKNRVWPNIQWQNLVSGEYNRAFIKLSAGRFFFLLGREHFCIGRSLYMNLLLSGYSPPFDGLFLSYESDRFKYSYLLSSLDLFSGELLRFQGDTIHSDTITTQRFYTLRRFDFNLTSNLEFGVTEVILHNILDACYLNPIASSFSLEFLRPYGDHNAFFDIDMKLKFHRKSLYGEFLVDDFQYLSDPQNEPNHIGLLLGFESLLFNNFFFLCEYSLATRWTYNHFFTWQKYEYLGFPIGHQLGSDFSKFFSKLLYLRGIYSISFSYSYILKGSTALSTLWPIPEFPRVSGTFFPENNFLSPPVSYSNDLRIGVNIYFHNISLFSELGFNVSSIAFYPVFKFYLCYGKKIIDF